MAFNGVQFSVGTGAAVEVVRGDVYGLSFCVLNKGSASVYLDGTNAVDNTGFELDADLSLSGVVAAGESIWAKASTGTQSIHVVTSGSD